MIGKEEIAKIFKELMEKYPNMLSSPLIADYDENGVAYWDKWQEIKEQANDAV